MPKKLTVLMLFHACWGIALGLSISKYGLGVSTDATAYMFAGVNWIEGHGLIDFSGSQYILWPPLYPMLIGFVHLTGLNGFAAAHVIQFVSFALIAYFSSIFLLKLFPDDFAFALLGAFLLDTGAVVLSTFYMIGTDYLFMLCPIVFALLLNEYTKKQKWTTLTLLALTVSIATLLRYLGYCLVLTALFTVLCYTTGSALKRILRTAYAGLFSIPPFLWMFHTWNSVGTHRTPLAFQEYAGQFTTGVIAWFTPNSPRFQDITAFHYALVWGWVLLALALLFSLSTRVQVLSPLIVSTLGFGALYTLALFTNALIAYFNRLWGRFQLPIYFPLVILFLVVIGYGTRYLKENHSSGYYPVAAIGFAFLILASGMQFHRSIALMRAAVNGIIPENGINTRAMNENSVIRYWQAHPPSGNYRLFSNYGALGAFFTGHETLASPRRSGIYDTTIIPLENYAGYLFPDNQAVYLLWIEPNSLENVYQPDELAPIAQVETIFENKEGGIYLLHSIDR